MCWAMARKGRVEAATPRGFDAGSGPTVHRQRDRRVRGEELASDGTEMPGGWDRARGHPQYASAAWPDERECAPRRHVRAGGCGARGLGWTASCGRTLVAAWATARSARCRASCTDARPGRVAARRSHAACVHSTSKLNRGSTTPYPLCSVPILPRPLRTTAVARDVTCARRETSRQTWTC